MKLIISITLACLIFLSFGVACKQNKSAKRLAFVTNNASDYWTIARKGTEKAAAELPDVTVEFRIPGNGTAAEQKGIFDDLLAKGIDGIAISPKDPANQTQMINDAAKQALVITQDSDAPKSDRACYIGTDNVAAGRQEGELIKEVLPQGGKIMVFVGKREVENAQERFKGLKESLQGSNVVIIDLMTDDANPATARDNAYQTLKKYPDIAGMVGLWSYNGPSIVQALRPEGKLGTIKIVCFDDERETLAAIKEGTIFGTVAQQPFEYGYEAVKTAAKILNGDRSVIPVNKTIFLPTVVIQRNNVDEYSKKLSQLLGT